MNTISTEKKKNSITEKNKKNSKDSAQKHLQKRKTRLPKQSNPQSNTIDEQLSNMDIKRNIAADIQRKEESEINNDNMAININPENLENSPNQNLEKKDKKEINVSLSETILILKMASTQFLLLFILALPLIQIYTYPKYNWKDGAHELLDGFEIDIPNFILHLKLNFRWPDFDIPRFTIFFTIGFSLVIMEYYLVFGRYMLEQLKSSSASLMRRKEFLKDDFEYKLSRVFSSYSWLPFRTLMDLTRTSLEESVYVWRNNIIDGRQKVSIHDEEANEDRIEMRERFNIVQKVFLTIFYFLLYGALLVPTCIAYFKPYTKVFGLWTTEEEIQEFCNDESALSYRGIELQSDEHMKNFLDSLGSCLWFRHINLSQAPNVDIDLEELADNFVDLETLNVHSSKGNFKALINLKSIKTIIIHDCEQRDMIPDLVEFWKVNNNCYIEIMFKNGTTPLIHAALHNEIDNVRLLLTHNVDIDTQTVHGQTPLLVAAKHNYLELAEILLENSANVNLKTNKHRSALITAAKYGHVKMLFLLLKYGAKVNNQTVRGASALLYAASEGHEECVRLLLQQPKCNLELAGRFHHGEKKKKPIEVAREAGHENIVNLLNYFQAHRRLPKKKQVVSSSSSVIMNNDIENNINDNHQNSRSKTSTHEDKHFLQKKTSLIDDDNSSNTMKQKRYSTKLNILNLLPHTNSALSIKKVANNNPNHQSNWNYLNNNVNHPKSSQHSIKDIDDSDDSSDSDNENILNEPKEVMNFNDVDGSEDDNNNYNDDDDEIGDLSHDFKINKKPRVKKRFSKQIAQKGWNKIKKTVETRSSTLLENTSKIIHINNHSSATQNLDMVSESDSNSDSDSDSDFELEFDNKTDQNDDDVEHPIETNKIKSGQSNSTSTSNTAVVDDDNYDNHQSEMKLDSSSSAALSSTSQFSNKQNSEKKDPKVANKKKGYKLPIDNSAVIGSSI